MTKAVLEPIVLPAAGKSRFSWRRIRREPITNIFILFVVLQAICIIGALAFPADFRYLTPTNVGLLFRAIPMLGIISLGVGMLMITGEFDLSVGSVYTLAGYSIALLYGAGMPVWVALLGTMVIGAAIGAANGIITVRAGIPSFIATMGSMLVVRGLVRWLSEGRSVTFHPDETFTDLVTGSFAGIEAPFLWFVLLTIIVAVIVHRTKLGNHMYLVGGNEKTALAVGINTRLVKIIAFSFSGLGASIAGIISTTRVSTVTPAQGVGLELKAVAICVIGGLFLSGGRGTVLGIFLGACLMYLVEDVLLLLRAPGFYLDVFVGAILVIAVVVNTWLTKKSSR
ncbi:MAG TPA: ABC transporter permease [Stellaceae bacterium]|jgi:ribose/xylose/arabinose/galactoside ABC-type transport system permease subunit|nr:ABC transporter permease [Stellaceae bacterium]